MQEIKKIYNYEILRIIIIRRFWKHGHLSNSCFPVLRTPYGLSLRVTTRLWGWKWCFESYWEYSEGPMHESIHQDEISTMRKEVNSEEISCFLTSEDSTKGGKYWPFRALCVPKGKNKSNGSEELPPFESVSHREIVEQRDFLQVPQPRGTTCHQTSGEGKEWVPYLLVYRLVSCY